MSSQKALLDKNFSDAPIATIREIIAGQQLRDLEAMLARHGWALDQLAEQNRKDQERHEAALRQLREECADKNQRRARRSAQYRRALRLKLRALANNIDELTRRIEAETGGRSTVAETMAALAKQLRAIPSAPETPLLEAATPRPRARAKTRNLARESDDDLIVS